MGRLGSEFVEVFGEPVPDYGRLASEFVEVFGEPIASYARLASEFVEVFGTVPGSYARLASEFVEVFGEPEATYARLASEFVEVFGEPEATYARLASEFVEVFGVAPAPIPNEPCAAGKPGQWFISPDVSLRGRINVESVTTESGAYPGSVVPDSQNFGALIPSISGNLTSLATDVDLRVSEAGGVGMAEFVWRESGVPDGYYGIDDVRRFWGFHSPLGDVPGSDNVAAAFAPGYRRVVIFHGTSGSTAGLIKYRDIDTQRYDSWTGALVTLADPIAAGDHNARMVDLPDGRLMLVVRRGTGNLDFDVYHSDDGGLTWQRVSRQILSRFGGGIAWDSRLPSQFQLARAGEYLRIVWASSTAVLQTVVSSDRGITWTRIADAVPGGVYDTGDADDPLPFSVVGISDSGEFLLRFASAATTIGSRQAVADGSWGTVNNGSTSTLQNVKQIVLVKTPEFIYEWDFWSDATGGTADGWTMRRARPARYLDFLNNSGSGWEERDQMNGYDTGIAYIPGRVAAAWCGAEAFFVGSRRGEAAGIDINRASAWTWGGWTQRSIYRAQPATSLDEMTNPFQDRLWTTECGEPSQPTGSPWTTSGTGTAAHTMDYLEITSPTAPDDKQYQRQIPAATGPAWGQDYGAVFGWVVRIDTGTSGVGADRVAVRIRSRDQANTTLLDVSIRMATTCTVEDNNASATLDTLAVDLCTGSSGQFFECRWWMVQNAGPTYNGQLAIFDTETEIWTVGAVVTLTTAASPGPNRVEFGHLNGLPGMVSWWREFWIVETNSQRLTAEQEGFVNPASLAGMPTSPRPVYLQHGMSVAWGGVGGARGDDFTGEVLHVHAAENVAIDSPRIHWQSATNDPQTLILDAGSLNRWKCTAIAAFGTNDRQILVDFDDSPSFASPTAVVTLDATAYGTATLPLRVGTTDGKTLVYTTGAGSGGRKLQSGELVGCYVRPTTGAATGITWLCTRHEGATLYFDGETARLDLQGLGVGDSLVVFADRAVVDLTAPNERYMRLRFLDADTAQNWHQMGTLVVGRRVDLSVPLDWAFTDNEQPNVTQYRTRGGIAWAYQEAPPQRTIQARMVGDASRFREQVRFLKRQFGYEARPTAWVLEGERAVESLLLARITSGSQLDQAGWYRDQWDILRTAGDESLTLVEEI